MRNLKKITAAVFTAMVVIGLNAPMPANAALSQVGPVNPNTGFPLWYRDANGLTLDLMEAADPFGISDPVNPANPFSQQIGFNAEGFWWSADASFDNGSQTGLLVLAMEAAFAGEAAVDGEQSAFGRIRYRVTGLTPGETYTVRHPFGNATEIADGAGVINVTNDVGCFAQAGVLSCDPNNPAGNPHNFSLALQSGIGPFLTWDTFGQNPVDPLLVNAANPNRRYVGNPAVAHAITGSPINQNLFAVEGPGLLAGTQTSLFTVTGRLADITPPVITVTGANPASVVQGLPYNDAGATALDDMDGDVTANIVVTGLPINTAVVGANTVTYTVSDVAGNTATATRTVNVTAAPLIPEVTVNSQTAVTATPTITGTVTDPAATVSVVVNAQPAINATVNPDGTWSAVVATALANGTYDVQASATNANGTGTDATVGELIVNVGAAQVLTTINVTPANPSIAIGATQQFTASALDQTGVAMNPQPAFTWTSGTPATGTIDANGLFTAAAAGTSVVTATSGAVSGTSTATVTAAAPPVTPPAGGGGGGGGAPAPAENPQPQTSEGPAQISEIPPVAVTKSTATITVKSDAPIASRIVFIEGKQNVLAKADVGSILDGKVKAPKKMRVVTDDTITTDHIFNLARLKKNKTYFYKIIFQSPDGSNRTESQILSFRTAKK